MRSDRVLVSVLVLVPTVFGGLALADAPLPCPGFTMVPGQGPSCPEAGGWRVLLADGSTVFTHGGDPVPGGGSHGAAFGYAPPVEPACVDDPLREFHSHVIYARAVVGPDRYDEMAPQIRTMVEEATGMIDAEASQFGVSWRLRVRCAEGELQIDNVVLPILDRSTAFASVVEGLKRMGYQLPTAKYWVWWDGPNSDGWGGFGHIEPDASPGPGNLNNRGPMYAVTFGQEWYWGSHVMLHELGHNLGAVVPSAPGATAGFHCNDGEDVMCYADGTSGSNYNGWVCWTRAFDCNHDTYFHPDPTSGWLTNHWNLGSPVHRFFEGCAYEQGRLATGAAGMRHEGLTHAIVPVPAACAGHRYAMTGPGQDNMDVCWVDAAGADLACSRKAGSIESGVVPAGAVAARIEYPRIAGGEWFLSVQ